jgi:hypothetical protein
MKMPPQCGFFLSMLGFANVEDPATFWALKNVDEK